MTRLFVYGTLLRSEPNAGLLARARFVCRAATAPAFELYDLGSFPGLVPGGTTRVAGELYDVDGPTLATLDRLEGHPTFYQRSTIELDDGTPVVTYLLRRNQVVGFPTIACGSWRAYRRSLK